MKIGKKISSVANPLVREIQLLAKSKARKEKNLLLAEGVREILMALKHGYHIDTLICLEEDIEGAVWPLFKPYEKQIAEVVSANRLVFEKIAYRENGAGAVAILQGRSANFDSITLNQQPLILVIVGVEKPGNLGAMIRTANAAGVTAMLVCDPLADIYNPNCIRASLGAVFASPVLTCSSQQAIEWLQKSNIQIITTYLEAAVPYYQADLRLPSALVVGSEASGISGEWLKAAKQNIIIPMPGEVDSLNVSNAAAIVLFEALRQRGA